MKKPFKYTIICDKTGFCQKTNTPPLTHQLQTYEDTDEVGVKKLTQTKTAYIDTRYDARIRLYNYLTYTKLGIEIPKYQPFKGAEIGKTIPILSF